MSGLSYKKALVGTVWAVSLILCMTGHGLRKPFSHLVGPPFLALKVFHSLDGQMLAKGADYWDLVNEGVWLE